MMMFASIMIPLFAIFYTLYQSLGFTPQLMAKLIIGCDYSVIESLWINTGLQCENLFSMGAIMKNTPFALDIMLLYCMTFSTTFFRIWKGQVFLSDPSTEFCGWSVLIMRFNSEEEVSFSTFPFMKKGYWLQPIENSKQFELAK
ncbi:MAG: hypothetical protein PHT88_01745 [Candidatus Moranbacteria bacterium]|nr:hypothetical protein [Candidatus Moranbacteria bacterium]